MFVLSLLILTACGEGFKAIDNLPPVGVPQPDGSIVRSRAVIHVNNEEPTYAKLWKKFYNTLIIPIAYAYTGGNPNATINITYANAENVSFVIDTTNLGTGMTESGGVLDIGDFEITSLDDNKLKVCSAPTKCQQAAIRVYTVGPSEGFRNITDGDHFAPVYISGLNPSISVGLTDINSIDIVQRTVPSNDNRLTLDELSQVLFSVSADMANAGAGDYEMDLVIEYVLRNP